MKNYIKCITSALFAVVLTTSAFAADTTTSTTPAVCDLSADSWVISLGGVGTTETQNSGTAYGVDLSVGRTGKFLLPNEFGIRQSISHDGDATLLNTRAYNDWTLLTYKKVDLFVGGAIGLQYGNTTPNWEIAPEAGLRWWVKHDVAVLARVEVPWNLENWEYKDTLRYFIGFSVRF